VPRNPPEINRPQLDSLLEHGLESMGLRIETNQKTQLLAYVVLLHKWNQAFNLSAVRDPVQMISRHILDSLSLIKLTKQSIADGLHDNKTLNILDVGTGPGLPGIPLAICLPGHQFILLDSNGKKTRFVLQATLELGLANIKVENTRIESYQSPRQLDIVVSRAFSSLAEFVTACQHLCSPQTRLLAMKGQFPEAEMAELPAGWQTAQIVMVEIPECGAERHIVELVKIS